MKRFPGISFQAKSKFKASERVLEFIFRTMRMTIVTLLPFFMSHSSPTYFFFSAFLHSSPDPTFATYFPNPVSGVSMCSVMNINTESGGHKSGLVFIGQPVKSGTGSGCVGWIACTTNTAAQNPKWVHLTAPNCNKAFYRRPRDSEQGAEAAARPEGECDGDGTGLYGMEIWDSEEEEEDLVAFFSSLLSVWNGMEWMTCRGKTIFWCMR